VFIASIKMGPFGVANICASPGCYVQHVAQWSGTLGVVVRFEDEVRVRWMAAADGSDLADPFSVDAEDFDVHSFRVSGDWFVYFSGRDNRLHVGRIGAAVAESRTRGQGFDEFHGSPKVFFTGYELLSDGRLATVRETIFDRRIEISEN
jgi:hypothetical protein